MKILHVITSMGMGGAQRLLVDLIPLQKAKGNQVLVACLFAYENRAFIDTIHSVGVEIVQLYYNRINLLTTILRLSKLMRKQDVVHVHLYPALYISAIASLFIHTPLVWTEHSTSNSRRSKSWLRPIERWVYSKYNRLISISQQTQDNLISWIGQQAGRNVIINNGVDNKRFKSIHKTVDDYTLIMISRFTASKDQETVIRAMKYINGDTVLRFVGDGETREKCEKLAKELGVYNRIEFLGSRSDIAELICSSYIGVQSSNWEGFGLTAVEIMSAGKPVVASNVNGLRQVVEGAGVIFEHGNERELADIINKLLNDTDYYNRIAMACMLRSEMYSIERTSEKYLDIYYELANGKG